MVLPLKYIYALKINKISKNIEVFSVAKFASNLFIVIKDTQIAFSDNSFRRNMRGFVTNLSPFPRPKTTRQTQKSVY